MNRKRIKVITILGTRPEIIRLSRVIALLEKHIYHKIIHTGQNYDYELNEIFFKEMEIPKPEYFLNVDTKSLGSVLGETLIKTEIILKKELPDAVLILGDTNSSIAGIIAKRLKIPIYHMEAGNRCFDMNVPEEINRKIIDHIADFNLVYTENARRHLLSEGLHHRRIYLTGSPLKEVINYYKDKFIKSKILNELALTEKEYFVVSMHREENVDYLNNLKELIRGLELISKYFNKKIIISTHPRIRKRLNNLKLKKDKNFYYHRPFGYFDYVKLQMNSICTISDSGTISEESSLLDFPAVTIRNSLERPEAMDSGAIILTGVNAENILNSVLITISIHKNNNHQIIPVDYNIDNTSERVLKLIQGTALLSNKWSEILKNR